MRSRRFRADKSLIAFFAFGFALFTLAGPDRLVLAQTDDRFFGHDERVIVKPTDEPWWAIGKIIMRNGDFCSGTLIAADIALTAAHCVFDGDDADPDAPYLRQSPVYFIAGYHQGRFTAVTQVLETWVPPEFDMSGFLKTFDYDDKDFAFLRLREPIGHQTGWFQIASLDDENQSDLLGPDGPKVNQAGYSGDSSALMTAHIGCRLIGFEPNNTVWHECDTMTGDSGSPLFYHQNDHYWLIALESQSLQLGDQWINSAVDARAFTNAFEAFQQN